MIIFPAIDIKEGRCVRLVKGDFNKITSQHWQRINNNKNQIRTLEKLRGVLLPKLMNGEVSVQCKDNKNLMINE